MNWKWFSRGPDKNRGAKKLGHKTETYGIKLRSATNIEGRLLKSSGKRKMITSRHTSITIIEEVYRGSVLMYYDTTEIESTVPKPKQRSARLERRDIEKQATFEYPSCHYRDRR